MSKPAANEPHWEHRFRGSIFKPLQSLGIVARHLFPVGGVLALGWSEGQFQLLNVFKVCFNIVSIGMLGRLGSTHKPSSTSFDANRWGQCRLICTECFATYRFSVAAAQRRLITSFELTILSIDSVLNGTDLRPIP